MPSFADFLQQGTGNAWLFVPSAIVLGALHGLEPGHSKTMMAAFIVAIRGTVGATQRLPRVLGKRLAKDMMFTGRTLSAEEALAHGLVSRLVDAESLEAAVEEVAKAILAAPKGSLAAAKRVIDRGVELDPAGALAAEIEAIEAQLASGQWMGKS